jgi:hypothetical protein
VIAVTNSIDNWLGLGLAVVGMVYLIMVLIFPERF